MPLANETIAWPRETTLCLPQFITPCHSNESKWHSTATEHRDATPSPSMIQPHPPHQTTTDHPHTGTPTNHPPLQTTTEHPHTGTPTNHPPHQTTTEHPPHTQDTQLVTSHSSVDVFPELPKSREGLKELRAQLSMELLWIKQAIASRQNVSTLNTGVVLCVTALSCSICCTRNN